MLDTVRHCTSDDPRSMAEARRARDMLLICTTAWLAFGVDYAILGRPKTAVVQLLVGALVACFLALAWAGEPRRARLAAHLNFGVSIIGLVVLAALGGGTESMALWFLAALPALVGYQFGGRAALVWGLAVLAGVTLILSFEVAPPLSGEFVPGPTENWIAASVMAVILILLGLSSQSTTRRLERGLSARNIALREARDRIMAKDRALREALAEAREQAIRDPLTGVFNRRWFDTVLPLEMDRARRDNTGLVLLIVDIDRFKRINDKFGHPIGDAVLRTVCQLLCETFRHTDMVCRLGGDEFCVVLPMASPEAAVEAVSRFQDGLSAAKVPGLDGARLSVSLGYARFDGRPSSDAPTADGTTGKALAEGLLHLADAAMYEAKRRGGGVLVTADELPDDALDSLSDEQDLAVIEALR